MFGLLLTFPHLASIYINIVKKNVLLKGIETGFSASQSGTPVVVWSRKNSVVPQEKTNIGGVKYVYYEK